LILDPQLQDRRYEAGENHGTVNRAFNAAVSTRLPSGAYDRLHFFTPTVP
jgi:hypothetical protein